MLNPLVSQPLKFILLPQRTINPRQRTKQNKETIIVSAFSFFIFLFQLNALYFPQMLATKIKIDYKRGKYLVYKIKHIETERSFKLVWTMLFGLISG